MAWEDLLISFRLTLYRDPDVYNDYLVGLLKHANASALQAVEAYETGRDESERITVACDGARYDIPATARTRAKTSPSAPSSARARSTAWPTTSPSTSPPANA